MTQPMAMSKNVIAIFWLLLVSATFLQRFGVSFAGTELPYLLVAGIISTTLLFMTGALKLDIIKATFFLMMATALLIASLLSDMQPAYTAYFIIIAIYACWIFTIPTSTSEHQKIVRIFVNIMAVCGVLGTVQFLIQFAFGQDAMFPLDNLVPEQFLLSNYMTRRFITYGDPTLKSIGFFFVEPSVFSQSLAWALLVKLTYLKFNIWKTACLIAGLIASLAGTGIVLLMLALPLILIQRGNVLVISIAFVGAVLLLIGGELFGLTVFTERLEEFSDPYSSAYERFIAPIKLMGEFITHYEQFILFGVGAGNSDLIADNFYLKSLIPLYLKLFMEYGIVGLIFFMAFVLVAILRSGTNKTLSFIFLINYLFLGGNLSAPFLHFTVLPIFFWFTHCQPQSRLHSPTYPKPSTP